MVILQKIIRHLHYNTDNVYVRGLTRGCFLHLPIAFTCGAQVLKLSSKILTVHPPTLTPKNYPENTPEERVGKFPYVLLFVSKASNITLR